MPSSLASALSRAFRTACTSAAWIHTHCGRYCFIPGRSRPSYFETFELIQRYCSTRWHSCSLALGAYTNTDNSMSFLFSSEACPSSHKDEAHFSYTSRPNFLPLHSNPHLDSKIQSTRTFSGGAWFGGVEAAEFMSSCAPRQNKLKIEMADTGILDL